MAAQRACHISRLAPSRHAPRARWPCWRELFGTFFDRRRRTVCSRRERRSATHTTAHARPHTRERATRQWQHDGRATARAWRDPGTPRSAGRAGERLDRRRRTLCSTGRAGVERAALHSIETGGGVRSAAAASVGAPRTQQYTHAHTHESAPHVSGSMAGGPQLAPGATTAHPAALAVLESG